MNVSFCASILRTFKGLNMLKKLSSFFIVLGFVLAWSSMAQARIYILIDEVSQKKFPIAIPDFVTSQGKKAGGPSKKMLELMKKDLKIADMFQVMDDSLLPQRDEDTTTINYKKWQAIDMGALIKGVVSKGSGGTKVQLRLYDVMDSKMIYGREYLVTAKNQVDVVHRFVDGLMKALTGIRGPFESKIAASCGGPFKRQIGGFEIDSERTGGIGAPKGKNNISPAISPNGKRVAYTSFNTGNAEVWVDGRQVTRFGSTTITPTWTPDGTRLIVASAKTGTTDLYLINLNGKVLKRLTNGSAIDFDAAVNGGQVAFASERAGGVQIFSTGAGGGGVSQLTYTGYQNLQPDWSPDGSKIVFAGKDRGSFDIFVMDSDGSNILRVTRDKGNNESPSWSPDGRYIAYHSSRGGIYVQLEEGLSETVIEKTAGCINLDWGPWLSQE